MITFEKTKTISAKEIQKRSVVYLGPEFSYHYSATCTFLSQHELGYSSLFCKPATTFTELLEMVETESMLGVIAIHNTIAGDVFSHSKQVLDKGLNIFDSVTIDIDHMLLGIQGAIIEDITDVYVHPQVQIQTSSFLQQNPQMHQHIVTSTSAGAEIVSKLQKKTAACIGSTSLTHAYGLEIITSSIANEVDNKTTFWVIGS